MTGSRPRATPRRRSAMRCDASLQPGGRNICHDADHAAAAPEARARPLVRPAAVGDCSRPSGLSLGFAGVCCRPAAPTVSMFCSGTPRLPPAARRGDPRHPQRRRAATGAAQALTRVDLETATAQARVAVELSEAGSDIDKGSSAGLLGLILWAARRPRRRARIMGPVTREPLPSRPPVRHARWIDRDGRHSARPRAAHRRRADLSTRSRSGRRDGTTTSGCGRHARRDERAAAASG